MCVRSYLGFKFVCFLFAKAAACPLQCLILHHKIGTEVSMRPRVMSKRNRLMSSTNHSRRSTNRSCSNKMIHFTPIDVVKACLYRFQSQLNSESDSYTGV